MSMEANQSKALPKKEFYEKLNEENKDYESNKEIHNMDEREAVTDHDHFFTMVSGNQIECQCGWGLYLGPRDEFRDGHLFVDNKKIV